MLGRGGWGILGTVSGDVGSKRVIFHGSWGYVVTFWCRPVPETLPGCTLAGSWVAGWGAWGPRGSPGREGSLRDAFPRCYGREASEMLFRVAGEARGGRARKL